MPQSPDNKASEHVAPSPFESATKAWTTVQELGEFIARREFTSYDIDFLVINDIAFDDAVVTSLNVQTDTDMFVGEILRASSPIIQSHGTGLDVVSMSVQFTNGPAQQKSLRRLMAELLNHPFVFVENNRLREALGYDVRDTSTMMFVLHNGSIRAGVGQVGLITLDLQLATFNYKPFSNHYWYNADLPGEIAGGEDAPMLEPHGELLPGDPQGRESFDYSKAAFEQLSVTRLAQHPDQKLNTPVVYPSGSRAWMYYADQMEQRMPRLEAENRDYVGLEVDQYSVFPPPPNARIGQGDASKIFRSHDWEEHAQSFYDGKNKPIIKIRQPLPEGGASGTGTGEVSNVEAEYEAVGAALADEARGRQPYNAIALHMPQRKGGPEFEREAKNFAKHHGKVLVVANPKGYDGKYDEEDPEAKKERLRRVQAVTDNAFARCSGLRIVTFFCHGYANTGGGMQLYPGGTAPGETGKTAIQKLVNGILPATRSDLRVFLYACDCGRNGRTKQGQVETVSLAQATEGSYARILFDSLASRGKRVQVDAHMTAGHTTRNPYLVRFSGPAGTPPVWVVKPGSKLWKKWQYAIHFDLNNTLRFRLPEMSIQQIHAELSRYVIPQKLLDKKKPMKV